jgi:hypothetical protein
MSYLNTTPKFQELQNHVTPYYQLPPPQMPGRWVCLTSPETYYNPSCTYGSYPTTYFPNLSYTALQNNLYNPRTMISPVDSLPLPPLPIPTLYLLPLPYQSYYTSAIPQTPFIDNQSKLWNNYPVTSQSLQKNCKNENIQVAKNTSNKIRDSNTFELILKDWRSIIPRTYEHLFYIQN